MISWYLTSSGILLGSIPLWISQFLWGNHSLQNQMLLKMSIWCSNWWNWFLALLVKKLLFCNFFLEIALNFSTSKALLRVFHTSIIESIPVIVKFIIILIPEMPISCHPRSSLSSIGIAAFRKVFYNLIGLAGIPRVWYGVIQGLLNHQDATRPWSGNFFHPRAKCTK